MSIIFDIEYKTIITPIDVIKATPPILGFTIIIKPHNIDIIEQINEKNEKSSGRPSLIVNIRQNSRKACI